MEGIPHDFGYEGDAAIVDTRKALIEARMQGCIPIVFTYGRKISDSVRTIANHCIYREVGDVRVLPLLLPNLYRKLT